MPAEKSFWMAPSFPFSRFHCQTLGFRLHDDGSIAKENQIVDLTGGRGGVFLDKNIPVCVLDSEDASQTLC